MPRFIDSARNNLEEWYKSELANCERKDVKQCKTIHEFLDVTLEAMLKISNLFVLMGKMLEDPNFIISSEDRIIYEQYLSDLRGAIVAFDRSNFVTSVVSPITDGATTVGRLNNQFSSQEVARFNDMLAKLALSQPKMTELHTLNQENWDPISLTWSSSAGFSNFINIGAYFISPYQLITRYPIMALALREQLDITIADLGNELLTTSKRMADTLNNQVRAQECCQYDIQPAVNEILQTGKSTDRNIAFCREILKLNIHNPTEGRLGNEAREKQHFFDAVLKKLIAASGSKAFVSNRVLEALGIKITDKILFDSRKFKPRSLQEFYDRDRNPLWLVLKSTIPISEQFTAEDKVKAYIDVAAEYKKGTLGNKDKYLGAYSMAQAAYAVARLYSNEGVIQLALNAFAPFHTNTSIPKQCAEKRFGNWIMQKVRAKHDNTVSERTLKGIDLTIEIGSPTLEDTTAHAGGGSSDTNFIDSGLDASPPQSENAAAAEEAQFPEDEIEEDEVYHTELPTSPSPVTKYREQFGLFERPCSMMETALEDPLLIELKSKLDKINDPALVEAAFYEFRLHPKFPALQQQWGQHLEEALDHLAEKAWARTQKIYQGPGSIV